MLEKYTPLYLKYRPQSLAELVGQHSVAQTLINAIEHDRISHAYLFTGPRGTGKTSSARILAKSLNCEKGPTVAPCQVCPSCLEIKEGNSPAVFELDAASNNSVDDARALIERAPLVAQGGRFKLYIIDECHMLTKEAFNALLKTIEEPPPGVIFILATTEEHKVPPTIVSRCQRLMFKLVNQDELKVHLRNVAEKESINIADDALELVARRSGGGLRDALGLLDQAGLLSASDKPVGVTDLLSLLGAVQEDVLIKISAGVKEKDGSAVLSAIQSLLLDGREPAVLIQEMAKHFLNLARSCYNLAASKSQGANSAHAVLGSPSYLAALTEQAETYDPAEIAQIVELLDKLEQNVRRSSQPAMNLEMGLLSICHRHEISMMKELTERLDKLEGALSGNGFDMSAAAKSYGAPATKPGGYTAPATTAGAVNRTAPPPSNSPTPSYSAPPSAQPKPQYAPQPAAETSSPAPSYSAPAPPQATPAAAPNAAPQPSSTANTPTRLLISQGDDDDDTENVEPERRQDPEDDYVPQPIATAPVHSAPHAAPASGGSDNGNSSGSGISSIELDAMWSDIMEALQGRHIPTFSILTTHAFPISFERDDLTIGVRKDNFQKMIEGKAEHIKSAFLAISGKAITVRVKVFADHVGAAPRPSGNANGSAGRESRPKASSSAASDDSEGSHRGGQERPQANPYNGQNSSDQSSAPQPAPRREQPPARDDYHSREAAAAGPATATMDRSGAPGERKQSLAAPAKSTNVPDNMMESGISDAYRIFEGPGSRLM